MKRYLVDEHAHKSNYDGPVAFVCDSCETPAALATLPNDRVSDYTVSARCVVCYRFLGDIQSEE